ncbi:MAG: (Fe-S)-binding protein [Candidatus Methanofastidiosia archaeon]
MDDFISQVEACNDCGKCGEICSICVVTEKEVYTPDNKIKLLQKIENNEELEKDEFDSIYLCTRCGACDNICPVEIRISDIIQYERSLLAKQGREPENTKRIVGNILNNYNPGGLDNSQRASWVSDDLRFSDSSPLAYMAGCWVAFKHVEIARDTIKILNRCGIEPKLLENEKCCALFVIDNGHLDEAKEYAKEYIEYIESCGVEKLLVSCPSCYNVLKNMYPKLYRKPRFEVILSLELFKELIDSGKIKFKKVVGKASIKDACSVKEFYDLPREIVNAMGVSIAEPFNKETFCCGAPAGVKPNYGEIADAVGKVSLEKSKEVSEYLVTYCPFCIYHLEGVEEKNEIVFPMKDISTLILENMEKE